MSISVDIKKLLVARIEQSSPIEILRIASGLAANEQIEAISAGYAMRQAPIAAAKDGPRFVNLDNDGKPTTGEHVAVYDRKQELVITRAQLPGSHSWSDAQKACAEHKGLGRTGWRAPTVQELVAIVDYTKHSPAIDGKHFTSDSSWEWTSTKDASSPSDVAWGVGLGGGLAFRLSQSGRFGVRAVLAGQSLGLSF